MSDEKKEIEDWKACKKRYQKLAGELVAERDSLKAQVNTWIKRAESKDWRDEEIVSLKALLGEAGERMKWLMEVINDNRVPDFNESHHTKVYFAGLTLAKIEKELKP